MLTYNDLHAVTKNEQAHDGAVGMGTPAVQYAYDLGLQAGNIWVDNTRLEKVTYPDGRVIFYNFDAQGTIGDRVDRPLEVRLTSASGTVLARYEHTASGRLAEVDYGPSTNQPDVRSNYYNNDSDDEYEAYDRFGRVAYTERYRYSGTTGAIDKFDYTYDLAGNRLTRDLDSTAVSGAPTDHDHAYTFDELHRLKTFDEGQLSGGSITNKQYAEDWTLEQLGNWATFKQDDDGNGTWDLDQDRGHNGANETDEIDSSATHVAHDAAGNMTTIHRRPAGPLLGRGHQRHRHPRALLPARRQLQRDGHHGRRGGRQRPGAVRLHALRRSEST